MSRTFKSNKMKGYKHTLYLDRILYLSIKWYIDIAIDLNENRIFIISNT